jgi:hypothetical protein
MAAISAIIRSSMSHHNDATATTHFLGGRGSRRAAVDSAEAQQELRPPYGGPLCGSG